MMRSQIQRFKASAPYNKGLRSPAPAPTAERTGSQEPKSATRKPKTQSQQAETRVTLGWEPNSGSSKVAVQVTSQTAGYTICRQSAQACHPQRAEVTASKRHAAHDHRRASGKRRHWERLRRKHRAASKLMPFPENTEGTPREKGDPLHSNVIEKI